MVPLFHLNIVRNAEGRGRCNAMKVKETVFFFVGPGFLLITMIEKERTGWYVSPSLSYDDL